MHIFLLFVFKCKLGSSLSLLLFFLSWETFYFINHILFIFIIFCDFIIIIFWAKKHFDEKRFIWSYMARSYAPPFSFVLCLWPLLFPFARTSWYPINIKQKNKNNKKYRKQKKRWEIIVSYIFSYPKFVVSFNFILKMCVWGGGLQRDKNWHVKILHSHPLDCAIHSLVSNVEPLRPSLHQFFMTKICKCQNILFCFFPPSPLFSPPFRPSPLSVANFSISFLTFTF